MLDYILKQLNAILTLSENVVNYDSDEAVHDFRVALRRFLTIYNLLRKQVEIPVDIATQVEVLRNLRTATNKLRDLEVLKQHISEITFDTNFGEKGKANLFIILDKKIQKEHAEILNLLLNAELKEKITKISEFFLNFQYDISTTEFIKKFTKKIKKALSSDATDDALHMIRVNFKKIRYILEMSQPENPLIEKIKSVQELLGLYNDYRVGVSILKTIPEEKIILNKSYLYTIGFAEAQFLHLKDSLKGKIYAESKKILKEIKHSF